MRKKKAGRAGKTETLVVSGEYAAWAEETAARCAEISRRWTELNLAIDVMGKGASARFRMLNEIARDASLHQAEQDRLDQVKQEIERILAPMFKVTNALKSIEDFLYEMSVKE